MAKAPTPAPKAKKRPGPKRKPGQPKRGPLPWQPSPEQVTRIRLYAGLGSTQEQVATLFGVSIDTLKRNAKAKEAFEQGKAETIAKVAGALVTKALAGDTTSAIFYLKTQGGWKETVRSEHTGKVGFNFSNMSDEELEFMERILARGPDA